MKKEVLENYNKYLDRINLFKEFGYDIESERDFVLRKSMPLKGDILEVGTGKGHFAIALALNGYYFTSVDISEEAQQYAKLNVEYLGLQSQINFVIGDAAQLSFSDESFDCVFSINTVHHLSDPYKVADEFLRAVKKNGKIIICDFSKKGMDLVAKVHKTDGQEHCSGIASVNDMRKYFLKKNCNVELHKTVFQETIIISKHK